MEIKLQSKKRSKFLGVKPEGWEKERGPGKRKEAYLVGGNSIPWLEREGEAHK